MTAWLVGSIGRKFDNPADEAKDIEQVIADSMTPKENTLQMSITKQKELPKIATTITMMSAILWIIEVIFYFGVA